ncbi:hypothetical protein HGRIS_013425 [Hohenbuehelia grisea]|uniref:DUF974-domain-containing protein n=1 Tax=Hohenbuehelia grisea TaxID=104357 RepID=A0ABR3IVR2_9AGAR
MEAAQLLSLKVMRVSRPSLASAWEPFYSSSPSFSAHSTASILSLQGTTPLPLHPKTLRDFTHVTEVLTLPASFGAIQLGGTFSSCLCVNNEAAQEIEGVRLRVEMQTATSKVLLGEFGGPEYRLAAGDTLENVVSHEIKELGQHVLGCTVSYRLPPNARNAPGATEDPDDPTSQTFRKFYKFPVRSVLLLHFWGCRTQWHARDKVSNPLSVKTKVHPPRAPSALLTPEEREKIFLEVHIQNLTQDPIWFERMRFQCTEGWQQEDANITEDGQESIFSGSMALMQPQDMRQYIYILTPMSVPLMPVVHASGSTIPLGRLDISWRSSFGEPGRLLTSLLSRRIPVAPPPVQPTASALPAYLKRSQAPSSGLPSRPRSPQLIPSRPASPPVGQRPGSPFRNRPQSVPMRAHSPSISSMNNVPSGLPVPPPPPVDVDVTLIVKSIPRDSIHIEQPLSVKFAAALAAPVSVGRRRILKLAVQHLRPPKVLPAAAASVNPQSEMFSPKAPLSQSSTPAPTYATFNVGLAQAKLLAAQTSRDTTVSEDREELKAIVPQLPPPYFAGLDELRASKFTGATFVGPSAVFLPPVVLTPVSSNEGSSEVAPTAKEGGAGDAADQVPKVQGVVEFDLAFLPLQQGFVTVGGLRLLLVEDKIEAEDGAAVEVESEGPRPSEVRVLKEWDTLAEIWVHP